MNEIQQLSFDYSSLPADVATLARAASERIKLRLRRTAEDIVEIGRELSEVKERLPHGQFLPWVENEFEMSPDTAKNFMRVSERFGQIPKFSEFRPSVLYLLSAPSTPDSVVTQATQEAESGEKVTVSDVRRWKSEAEKAQKKVQDLTQSLISRTAELREAMDRPEKVIEKEVVPADYEAVKESLTVVQKRLDKSLKEREQAIKTGVETQIKARHDEVVKLEKRRDALAKEAAELKAFIEQKSSREAELKYQKGARDNVTLALATLATELVSMKPIDDQDNVNQWGALVDQLRNGAEAISRAFGIEARA